jgi:DNA polymerase III sliding clamp (beta) subunit (PCNA family)
VAVVVHLGDFRGKETVAVLRELLVKASKGQIVALGFNVEFKDGTQKTGFTGKYKSDPAQALRVANKMSQRLNAIRDLREAAGIRDEEDDDAGAPSLVVRVRDS